MQESQGKPNHCAIKALAVTVHDGNANRGGLCEQRQMIFLKTVDAATHILVVQKVCNILKARMLARPDISY